MTISNHTIYVVTITSQEPYESEYTLHTAVFSTLAAAQYSIYNTMKDAVAGIDPDEGRVWLQGEITAMVVDHPAQPVLSYLVVTIDSRKPTKMMFASGDIFIQTTRPLREFVAMHNRLLSLDDKPAPEGEPQTVGDLIRQVM